MLFLLAKEFQVLDNWRGGGKVESDFGLIAIVVFVGAQQIANVKDCHIYYVYSFVIDASFVV